MAPPGGRTTSRQIEGLPFHGPELQLPLLQVAEVNQSSKVIQTAPIESRYQIFSVLRSLDSRLGGTRRTRCPEGLQPWTEGVQWLTPNACGRWYVPPHRDAVLARISRRNPHATSQRISVAGAVRSQHLCTVLVLTQAATKCTPKTHLPHPSARRDVFQRPSRVPELHSAADGERPPPPLW